MSRCSLLLTLLLWPLASLAGHGLLNSFSDLEWLPPPGPTPDDWRYRLATWREQLALVGASNASAEFTLCLGFMRTQLADAEAMVAKNNIEAANIALARYRDLLERAQHASDAAAQDSATLRDKLARSLLEHQYMLSVDYSDLPADSRAVIAALMEQLNRRYLALRAQLPQANAAALFFKEEEVRWSWAMAQRSEVAPATP